MPTSDPTVISAAQAVGLAINYKRQVRLSRGLISAVGFICSAYLSPQDTLLRPARRLEALRRVAALCRVLSGRCSAQPPT